MHVVALMLALLLADTGEIMVGMHGKLPGVVLPGPELEVKPPDDSRAPFVLRIEEVNHHGNAFRYDFVYYALEPGTYDVTNYLRTKDGSPAVKLPAMPVKVVGQLGPGQVLPNALQHRRASWFVGYRLLMVIAAGWWLVGLLVILFWGRRRETDEEVETVVPLSVADRLRPLVERARAGKLSAEERAELERMLLAYWRGKLGLTHAKPGEALAKMRRHPEAGELLNHLEAWLHRPDASAHVDVAALLKPYERAADAEPEEVVA